MTETRIGFIGGGRITRIFLEGWRRAGRWPGSVSVAETDPEVLGWLRDRFAEIEAHLRRAIKAGVLLAYGTDAGVQTHGNNGKQLAIYVEAGMTPLQAIQSATTVASRLLRMETRIGKLGEGFYADVVALTGDPLANIRTLEEPVWVMKEGRVALDRTRPAASAPR